MSRIQGTFTYSANLEVLKVLPLDARQLVDTKADLINPVTWTAGGSTWLFNGAIVAVGNDGSNNGVYYLNDISSPTNPDYTNSANWIKIGSGTGTITGGTNGLSIFPNGRLGLGGNFTGATLNNPTGGILKYSTSPTFSSPTEIVDKYYVDLMSVGIHPKLAAEVATTTNIALNSGTTSIDGITLQNGWRVLVKNQTSGSTNGIYVVNSGGTWNRSLDFDFSSTGETRQGTLVPVITGNTQKNTLWVLVTPDPVVSGSSIVFSLFSSPAFTEGVGINITGSTISVDGNSLAGNSIIWTGNTFNVDINSGTVSTLLTGATNGLTKVGRNAELGGILTSNVTINTSGKTLVFGKDGYAVKIDPISVIIGDTGFSNNFIYVSPALTEINAGSGVLLLNAPTGITLQSDIITVDSNNMRYVSHPTFTGDTQLVDKKYVDSRASGSTVYNCASPSTTLVGGMSPGTPLTGRGLDDILQEILAPYIAPSFNTFSFSVSSPVEVGYVLNNTPSKSFSWSFVPNDNNVQTGLTVCICDVTVPASLASLLKTASPATVSISPRSFSTCGAGQTWSVCAKNTHNVTITPIFTTLNAILPYYWGLCTCPGPSGANRPVGNAAMVLSGTKVLADSSGNITIPFNSTGNDYLWFAIPSCPLSSNVPTKTCWCQNPSVYGNIGGVVSPGGNLFPTPDYIDVVVTSVSPPWTANYDVYISNKQSTAPTLKMGYV